MHHLRNLLLDDKEREAGQKESEAEDTTHSNRKTDDICFNVADGAGRVPW